MLKRCAVLFCILFVVVGMFSAGFYFRVSRPIRVERVEVVIEPGLTLKQIALQLQAAKVLPEPWLFLVYATITGRGRSLQAGDYLFEGITSVPVMVERLVRGDILLFSAKILEGWNVREIATTMAGQDYISNPNFAAEFMRLCEDKSVLASYQIDAPTCEGYLFPDTYRVRRDISADHFFRSLIEKFLAVYQERVALKAQALGWKQKDVVILASLIEKETGAAEERPLISSVFHNRLKKGMLLQSDPTIIYGLKNFTGNIRKTDITNPHRYNTYVQVGLPPGPICNPGLASLLAAVSPAATKYLYFVSKNDGTHQFSITDLEHAAAVQQYQRK